MASEHFFHDSRFNKYLETCGEVEAEFARNRRLHGDHIHCRPGCSDCCYQIFQVTEIEAAYIVQGVRQMSTEARRRLLDRARPYHEARRKLTGANGEPEAWGSLPPPGTRLACPALEDGVCMIYPHRPLICRKFGIPLYNPDKPGRVFACELNFKSGEEIRDPDLVQIQTGIHQRWKQVQAEYNEAGGWRDPEPLTVARAILMAEEETGKPGTASVFPARYIDTRPSPDMETRRQSPIFSVDSRLIVERVIKMLLFTVAWAVALFASAGRLEWTRGWIYLAIYLAALLTSMLLVGWKNPQVMAARARMHRGAKRFDKAFMALYSLLLLVLPVVAGLDAVRFAWSSMPFATVYAGAILLLLAFIPIIWTMLTNPFLETLVRIQEERGHHVVTNGPYTIVRHPMYVGCILQYIAVPLVLGSRWSFLPAAGIIVLFLWRTALEDRTLQRELPGYAEYARKTRSRLLPGIW